MTDSELPDRVVDAARRAGRTVERVAREHRAGKAEGFGLPRDEEGLARIVCRRHAERRAVEVDARGRPECFDGDHPACRGCVADVREGCVETW